MRITNYENGFVRFECIDCKVEVNRDVRDIISDNCALDIDLRCPVCDSIKILYFLRCTNPAMAKDLNTTLEVLKLRHREESNNGDKIVGKVSDRGLQVKCG